MPERYPSVTVKLLFVTIILGACLFAAGLVSIVTGSVMIPPKTVISLLVSKILGHGTSPVPLAWQTIIIEVRLPRTALGAIVGASLSAAGVTFQGLLRNPLADPYITGVSSGAALGAVLAIITGLPVLLLKAGVARVISGAIIPIFAFFGGMAAVYTVLALSRARGHIPTDTFLLAGVVVGSFFWAVVSFLMTVAGRALHEMIFWLMGSLSSRTWGDVYMVLPWALTGFGIMWFFSRDLNVLALGEESALQLGLDTEFLKKVLIIVASMVTAAAVAASGIIGFVGLVVPHVMRLLIGPDHRVLLPGSILAGAAFLVLADTLARVLIAPTEIPVGIITSMAGGPFFLYLLRRRKANVTYG